ncbi:DUF2188 domain-containing protein [Cupriavidus consociatus]|uniref:DUF2188 domain-containing protein n=1 Tax=Cupriavidus consociatus TaxID=2821357 RepID=UPI001AE126FF|nr:MULTISPECIES: DUF2188 domain-containing protein [unclassified Cupriavidus]MBP0622472.1 DUF2188 domain-containing protein [Cupriavidus sp. LEh25]MDK2659158.1 DUF2188 domain-containing protein [Cupriavidus sp. LEh21]
MQARIIRVLPAEHGWALELATLNMAPQRFRTMEAAIAAGWSLAIREKADLHIHRHDGDVRLRSADIAPE